MQRAEPLGSRARESAASSTTATMHLLVCFHVGFSPPRPTECARPRKTERLETLRKWGVHRRRLSTYAHIIRHRNSSVVVRNESKLRHKVLVKKGASHTLTQSARCEMVQPRPALNDPPAAEAAQSWPGHRMGWLSNTCSSPTHAHTIAAGTRADSTSRASQHLPKRPLRTTIMQLARCLHRMHVRRLRKP